MGIGLVPARLMAVLRPVATVAAPLALLRSAAAAAPPAFALGGRAGIEGFHLAAGLPPPDMLPAPDMPGGGDIGALMGFGFRPRSRMAPRPTPPMPLQFLCAIVASYPVVSRSSAAARASCRVALARYSSNAALRVSA